MNAITLTIDSDNLMKALLQAPDLLAKNMANAVLRTTKEIARSARSKAPKAFSTLTNSIKDTQISPYEAIVAPGVNYASYVEYGTKAGAMPNRDSIQDWIEVRNIQPNDPFMDERDLSFIIARSIAARGTPAQPFLIPAFEENKAKAERRFNLAINAAVKGKQR